VGDEQDSRVARQLQGPIEINGHEVNEASQHFFFSPAIFSSLAVGTKMGGRGVEGKKEDKNQVKRI
jgi:hypothetical protein